MYQKRGKRQKSTNTPQRRGRITCLAAEVSHLRGEAPSRRKLPAHGEGAHKVVPRHYTSPPSSSSHQSRAELLRCASQEARPLGRKCWHRDSFLPVRQGGFWRRCDSSPGGTRWPCPGFVSRTWFQVDLISQDCQSRPAQRMSPRVFKKS